MASKAEKVAVVKGLIAAGKTRQEIYDYADKETDWDVQERTIDGYIDEAGGIPSESNNGGEGDEGTKDDKTEAGTNAGEDKGEKGDEGSDTKGTEDKPKAGTAEADAAARAKFIKSEKPKIAKANKSKKDSREQMDAIADGINDLIDLCTEALPKLDGAGNIRRVKNFKDMLIRKKKTAFKSHQPTDD